MKRINPLCSFFLISVLSFSFSTLFSQDLHEDNNPWENEDIIQLSSRGAEIHNAQPDHWSLALIRFYQKKIATQSISRCPFYISCSNYTASAINKYGFLMGVSMFIDRNFYRENGSAQYNYSLKIKNGELKYDDSFFIYGN